MFNGYNNLMNSISQIKQMLSGNNPENVAMALMNRNPRFADFVNKTKGKSVEEICSMYNLDFNMVQNVLKNK